MNHFHNQHKIMQKRLQEIRDVLATDEISWKEKSIPENPGNGRAFQGFYKTEWIFLVVEFDIENQGFPPGSKGYDGTATDLRRVGIIHLTRELAEELFLAAEKSA